MKVLARGTVRVYPPRGEYQLSAQVLEPLGKGSLQQAFEDLKAKLEKEGLFEPARKRPLPMLPRADRRRELADGRRHPRHPPRAALALREPRGAALPRPRAGRGRCGRDRAGDPRAQPPRRARRDHARARRRQPRGPVGLQRGGGRAGDRRVAHPDDLGGGPRDRLHDRRLRGRPARAHAVRRGRARRAGEGGARRRGSPRSRAGATQRCGSGSRASARASQAATAHRVFAAERGRLRVSAQRVDELVRAARRRPSPPRRALRPSARRRLHERLEAFRLDRQLGGAARARRPARATGSSRSSRPRPSAGGPSLARRAALARRPVAAGRARPRLRRSSGTRRGRAPRARRRRGRRGRPPPHPPAPRRACAPPSLSKETE